jgi:probable HAF family extracellular repeat protein
MKRESILIALTLITLTAQIRSASGATLYYNVIDLGTLGGTYSKAYGVNDSGQIVGESYTGSNGINEADHGAFWTNSSSAAIDLGSLGGYYDPSQAVSINTNTQIVGWSYVAGDTNTHAVVWTNSSSTALDLGTLGGPNSEAYGINDSGKIVGYGDATNGSYAAFWNNSSSSPLSLGGLGGSYSAALGINDSGQIVGWAYTTGNAAYHGVLWSNSSSAAVDLGTLGGIYSYASGINNSQQIVGWAYTANNAAQHAAIWPSSTNAPIDLGTLGGLYSYANSINNSGQVVGVSFMADNVTQHAAVWSTITNAPIDLNTVIPSTSGWVLSYASAINDGGEIVGYGSVGGNSHAFALIPTTPPPGNLSITKVGTNIFLGFSTVSNALYSIQTCTNLVAAVWSTTFSNIVGTGASTNFNLGSPTKPRQFWRVGY